MLNFSKAKQLFRERERRERGTEAVTTNLLPIELVTFDWEMHYFNCL